MQLQGKVALITGGGAGIGEALARRFVVEGAKVCITGRRQEMLDRVAGLLPEGSAVACAGDVTDWDDVERMVATTMSFGGKIDVLINNAAIDPGGSVVDMDVELWRRVLETNMTGPFLMMKAAIPHMIEAGGGSIVNVASLAGIRCLPTMVAYCSSKAGLIMLTQQASIDYGPMNVRCNVVAPGACSTEMLKHSMGPMCDVLKTDIDGVFQRLTCSVPLRRVGSPDEMTGACVFLASDDSSYVTGALLVVDGGAAMVDVNGASISQAGAKWGVSEAR
jgi:meso-butanediol dehydrogenase / (S,S)-butanediol dehydrogenase / diacetyl reductase